MSLGPLRALPPDTTSLFDADVDGDLPSVTPTGIRFSCACAQLAAGTIVSEEGGEFTINFGTFVLTLEPKLGSAEKSRTDVETGNMPQATLIERLGG